MRGKGGDKEMRKEEKKQRKGISFNGKNMHRKYSACGKKKIVKDQHEQQERHKKRKKRRKSA